MARILSGIKPTGQLTLGNYIGALKNFPLFIERDEVFLFVADYHALTNHIEPYVLKENTLNIIAYYLAAGLDPNICTLFRQSDVSSHAELNVILQNFLYMGELSRMTQYKEKALSSNESAIGLGLFAYPVLMASDILLYDADLVPVGEDQVQHIELTRDLVKRFNNRFGKILKLPQVHLGKTGARIMSLSDPTKKMSKSDPKGDIYLDDNEDIIRKKIMSAVTDSDNKIVYNPEHKAGISNLLVIYASLNDISIKEAEKLFINVQYGTFKKAVCDTVVKILIPLQKRKQSYLQDGTIEKILNDGAIKAQKVALITLNRVKKAVGLL
jgi:tryptophanyl-tRNA synthetase